MLLSGYHVVLKNAVPFLPFSCSVIDFSGGKPGCPGRFVEGFSTIFGGGEPGFWAGRHARVGAKLAQGGKLVGMDDLGALRERAEVSALAHELDGPTRQVLKQGVHHGNGLDVIRGPSIGPLLEMHSIR